jgi:putative nucleotidyltransferase with HDIG domain
MKFEGAFLRSKVGLRIFLLFICCALLPIAALAVLSFSHVMNQLEEQGQRRLHQSSKDMGMGIFERLTFLEDEMKVVASKIGTRSDRIGHIPSREFGEHLKQRFKGLVLVTDSGKSMPLFGHIQNRPELNPKEKQHIRSGGTLVASMYDPVHSGRIFMSLGLDPGNPRRGILLGEIETTYLWATGVDHPLPPMTELCILDDSNNVLFSTLQGRVSFPEEVGRKMARSALGQFEWVYEKEKYLAHYWSIFLQGEFFTPRWTVVMSESKSNALAPMANFKRIFPLVIFMSLFVVLLLSVIQIRRSMVPLGMLQEGTRRIAAKDFDSRVTIRSNDEFEELAASFNTMASQLGKQFNALTTLAEIDRAILSSLETEKIVDVVLNRIHDVFPCDCVSVTLLDPKTKMMAQTYIGNVKPGDEKRVETINLTPEEVKELTDHPENAFVEVEEAPPNYLAPLARHGIKSFLVLPIILKKGLSGIITLGYAKSPVLSEEDFLRARELANQMAVAMSNAELIKELNELNWGTLTALARAIDAKSHWTAGHSERVTKLALKIGWVLGLPQEEMDTLHRGGLMHDIGKLGIPGDILDKPGELTDYEKRLMNEHVRLGARILEPITAYAEIIPIVLQHHEHFNGTGYPDGLAGETISLGARIFAVADSFDALTSDRPYRQALDQWHAIELIRQGAGSQFDPDIVQTFLEVMTRQL